MREMTPRSPFALLLLALVLGYALVMLIAPIVAVAQGALSEGIAPVLATFQEPNVVHALEVTFYMSLAAVLLNTLFGLVTAWVMVRQEFRGKRWLNLLIDIPFVFSPVIAGYALIVLVGRNGWLAPVPFPIVFALPGIFLAKTFVSLPFVTREVAPVLAALDREPEYAAYTLGASQWTTFRRIVLPAIAPGVLYGVVLTLARALGEFGAVAVVGGGIEGRTETATMMVFRALNDRNEVAAYSMALLLGLIAVAILMIMRFLRTRIASRAITS